MNIRKAYFRGIRIIAERDMQKIKCKPCAKNVRGMCAECAYSGPCSRYYQLLPGHGRHRPGCGKACTCGWRHPRAPSVRWLWKEQSAKAVPDFLRDTKVACMVTVGRPPEGEEEEDSENEEAGQGPP